MSVAQGEGRPAETLTISRGQEWVRTLARSLTLFRPPVRDPKFWATQGLVAAIAGGHDFLEATGVLPDLGMAYLLPISLFFIPVIYAALFFGLSGSLATALWCSLLTVPNWMLWHTGTARFGSISQMAIIDLVAIFVGTRVDAQMKTSQALQISESKYRGLFDTAAEGIIVLDDGQRIVECNAAAAALLQASRAGLRGRRFDDVLSQDVAEALAAAISDHDTRFAGGILLNRSGGEEVWVEPVCTPLAGQEGLTQVVLRNVTGQKRRQAELADYSAQIVRAQEEERRRLAQELHDDTVQSLLLLCRMLDDSDVNQATDAGAPARVVREAHGYAESLVGSVRALAWGLRPALLDDLGLSSALDRFVTDLTSRGSIRGKLVVRGAERRLPAEVELTLFRIAQEALHNVERHSGASRVEVSLRYGESETRLVVTDDGVGFRPPEALEALASERKLGLIGMQERTRTLGGKLSIRSLPNRGTRVAVSMPTP